MTKSHRSTDEAQLRADLHFLMVVNASRGPDRSFYRDALMRYLGGSEKAVQVALHEYLVLGEMLHRRLLARYREIEILVTALRMPRSANPDG